MSEAEQEHSIEEILSSIRKIIAEEDPPAPAEPEEEPLPTLAEEEEPAPAPEPVAEAEPEPEDEDDDVLELTPAMMESPPAPAPAPKPAAAAAPPPPPPPPVKSGIPAEPLPEIDPDEPIVSDQPAQITADTISRLTTTIAEHHLAQMSRLPVGVRTLDALVVELLRPMLRQWLDRNLPPMVERMVQKEIEKISRRADDI